MNACGLRMGRHAHPTSLLLRHGSLLWEGSCGGGACRIVFRELRHPLSGCGHAPRREQRRRCSYRAIHPLSRPAMAYSMLITLVDSTYTAFLVPLGVAFQFNAESFSWYNAVDIAGGARARMMIAVTTGSCHPGCVVPWA